LKQSRPAVLHLLFEAVATAVFFISCLSAKGAPYTSLGQAKRRPREIMPLGVRAESPNYLSLLQSHM
jgi:hypothetical protein